MGRGEHNQIWKKISAIVLVQMKTDLQAIIYTPQF